LVSHDEPVFIDPIPLIMEKRNSKIIKKLPAQIFFLQIVANAFFCITFAISK